MKHPISHTPCGACCTHLSRLSVQLEGLPVLEDISLHLHCGEMTAIIGPNGGGKTTLLKAVLRQVPYQGEITFTDSEGTRMGRPRIGYVPQHLSAEPLAPVTVSDFLRAALTRNPAFLPPSKHARDMVQEALAKTGVEKLSDRRLGALSGGEAQRVLLALALTPLPNLLLLDEPLSGVDAEGLSTLYALLDSLRRTHDISILVISHDFMFVRRFADRAVLLNHRVLAQGPSAQVLAGPAFASLFPGWTAE